MKTKKFFRCLIAFCFVILTLMNSMSAMAASVGSSADDISIGEDTVQSVKTEYDVTSTGSANTNAYLTVDDSNVIVSVPTTIILSGTADEAGNYVGKYSVKVSGDISGENALIVKPKTETVSLSSEGKTNEVATITQEQTNFTYEDLRDKKSVDGTVVATGLTAGSWKATSNFEIKLQDSVLPGYKMLYEYDLSATENDDVKAYYMVPNKNTSPIEVETGSTTGNMNLLTSFTNLFTPITAYAAENNVIEYNGIRYELSDEDTLVISGEGEMKENIQSDLRDYIGIYNAVAEKFNISYSVDFLDDDAGEGETVAYFSTNSLKPNWIKQQIDGVKYSTYNLADWNGYKHSLELDELSNDIEVYINEIVANYSVSMPKEVIILEGVTNISDKAFYKCDSLTHVTIPNSVTNIGEYAFYDCSLNEITIPNSVTYIGRYAFSNTNLSEVVIPDSVSIIGNSAFTFCKNLSVVKLPASITLIGDSAFTRLKIGATIYCETQPVADMLIANKNYTKPGTYIVVAPEMFS